jgi:hypothetical protein
MKQGFSNEIHPCSWDLSQALFCFSSACVVQAIDYPPASAEASFVRGLIVLLRLMALLSYTGLS